MNWTPLKVSRMEKDFLKRFSLIAGIVLVLFTVLFSVAASFTSSGFFEGTVVTELTAMKASHAKDIEAVWVARSEDRKATAKVEAKVDTLASHFTAQRHQNALVVDRLVNAVERLEEMVKP